MSLPSASWRSWLSVSDTSKFESKGFSLDRQDGDVWLVAAFQNTRYHPFAKTIMGRLTTRSAK